MAKTKYQLDFTISTTVRVYVYDDEYANYDDVVAEGRAIAFDKMMCWDDKQFDFDLVGEDSYIDHDDYDGSDRTDEE